MLEVVEHPNVVLTTAAQEITVFDGELRQLIDEMAAAMYQMGGVGLAAPQVNVSKRVLLIDPTGGEEANQLVAMINPVVFWTSSSMEVGTEGCLSLPGVRLQVPRSVAVNIEYHDVMGNVHRMSCTDAWKSRIVQHEIDHLNGVMMLDRVGPLARKLAMKGKK